jgi:hypothetical protein
LASEKTIKKIIDYSWTYFNTGLGVLQKPLSLVSFATTVYYLAFENIPLLKGIFPTFRTFLVIGGSVIIAVACLVGWVFVRTPFYKKQFELPAKNSPYANYKVQKVAVPFYEASAQLFEAHGIDTAQVRKIIEASK